LPAWRWLQDTFHLRPLQYRHDARVAKLADARDFKSDLSPLWPESLRQSGPLRSLSD
jgi:hypothetical protein